MRWIRKFKEGGSKCFAVKAGRGRNPKLTHKHKDEIKKYIEANGATLTSKQLQLKIKEEFGIRVSNVTAYRLLKELGFSYITPRPRHYKKDQNLQDEFKKKSYRGSSGEC